MENKTSLTFIVNGTETTVTVKTTDTLEVAARLALKQTGNIGRPLGDFIAIISNPAPGIADEWLRFDRKVNEQFVFKNGKQTKKKIEVDGNSVIFLSLKAGVGASLAA